MQPRSTGIGATASSSPITTAWCPSSARDDTRISRFRILHYSWDSHTSFGPSPRLLVPPAPCPSADRPPAPVHPRPPPRPQIGRAHVRTPVTHAHPVCRHTLEKK